MVGLPLEYELSDYVLIDSPFRLDTDMQRGLSEEEVKKRRAISGWNELEA